MNKALVTGASGFLGTALCEELARRGARVIAVVRETSDASRIETLPGLRVVRCDMEGYSRLPEMIADRGVDVFYHLAWRGSAGGERADYDIQISNIAAACRAVDACAAMGCGRFVNAASVMEIEVAAFMRTEESPPHGTIYSSAKLAADYMARAHAASLGVGYIAAMISNIYGPREIAPRLINSSLRRLSRGERCSFSPGEQKYDFIYIDDAVRAFAAIGETGRANRTYYIGCGQPRPLKDFLIEMGEAVGRPDLIGLGDIPFSGVETDFSAVNLDAVKDDTGFVPEISFTDGIKMTYEWIKGSIQEGS